VATLRLLHSALLSAALASAPVDSTLAQPQPHALVIPEGASALTEQRAVRARHFIAATNNPHATETARAILARGGSAADAAIAAQLVLGLVEPQSSGIGGGAFLLFWDARTRQLHFYDGRETAPAAVDPTHFQRADGSPEAFFDAVIGGHAVGTPGVVSLLALVHQQHGRLPWAELFEPAIALAERGFPVSERLHSMLRDTPQVAVNAAIRDYFFQPDGQPKAVGSLLRNPAYAETLRIIAKEGANGFYRGAIARDIVRAVQRNENRAGALALTDLAGYRALQRPPLCAPFRVYLVCGAPPPSSGATTVLAILGLLQPFDPATQPPGSTPFLHRFAEASRLAFADRDAYVADPAYIEVPTAALVDPNYLRRRAALITDDRALPQVTAGTSAELGVGARATADSPELLSTSHLSVVDRDGNALVMTTSIETGFGSRLLVRGFLLNNQLTDFSFTPTNGSGAPVANRIEPFKRPRSSMAPTIVFRDGEPHLLLGSPGGSRIIDYVAKTLLYTLDGGLPLDAAIASPHVVHVGAALELEAGRFDAAQRRALEQLGHTVKELPQTSGLNGVVIEAEGLTGAADPRREGRVGGD
jgi:gamma-glutamyltranspeptidase/glutathione hydrolase